MTRDAKDGSLTSADGIVFTGLPPADRHAGACAGAGRRRAARREVVVNGRRVKTVDVHAHCAVPEAMALHGQKVARRRRCSCRSRPSASRDGRAGHRRRGAQHQPLLVQGRPRRRAASSSRMQNEKLAEVCAAHPERFVAFASVALQHPDLAAEQLEEGVKKYGLRGAAIGGSVDGEELADPKFHPFWAKAEQLGVLVFIHPQGTGAPSELGRRLQGQRRARQRDRQSAGDDDRALAPDLRGHARPVPRAQDLRRARRRLPALVRRPLRRRLRRPSPTAAPGRSRRSRRSTCGSSTSTRSSSRPRRCATWSAETGSGPDRHGHRLSVPVDEDLGGPHPRARRA